MDRHFAVAYTAIEQRRRALAADASFGEGHYDSVIQRGIDDALACQDMLSPAPVKPTLFARLNAQFGARVRRLAHRGVSAAELSADTAAPRVTP